jgi:hypothetical protein
MKHLIAILTLIISSCSERINDEASTPIIESEPIDLSIPGFEGKAFENKLTQIEYEQNLKLVGFVHKDKGISLMQWLHYCGSPSLMAEGVDVGYDFAVIHLYNKSSNNAKTAFYAFFKDDKLIKAGVAPALDSYPKFTQYHRSNLIKMANKSQ